VKLSAEELADIVLGLVTAVQEFAATKDEDQGPFYECLASDMETLRRRLTGSRLP
jgi:hypothetical protein